MNQPWRREPVYEEQVTRENIHEVAKRMLASAEIFKNPLFNGRLEYYPAVRSLKLFVSAVDWFDHLMQSPGITEEQVVENTMFYVEKVRKTCKNTLSVAPAGKSITTYRKLCPHGPGCYKKLQCNGLHVESCAHIVDSSVGNNIKCGNYIDPQLVVRPFGEIAQLKLPTKFVLKARNELERDLMIFSDQHMVNRQLAENVDFWALVHAIVQTLDVGFVALNFGKWETRTSRDLNTTAIECHAHAHVILSEEGLRQITEDFKIDLFEGRKHPPPVYRLQDCAEVEAQRVLARYTIGIKKSVDALSGRMDSMSGTLASMSGRLNSMDEVLRSILAAVQVPSSK